MKTILATLLVAAAVCAAQKFQLSPETAKLLAIAQKDCAVSEGIDEKYLGRVNSAENFPTYEEIKCLSQCVFKKFNVMDDAGEFHDEVIHGYVSDPEKLTKILAVVNKCKTKADTACQRAYDVHSCFFKTINQ
ncbi:PREDICTED: pheromone-binding protein-related protein 6-like [Nicrophorus vespilloides]|uniref:Pheromone-binding protein-related protein 6-like n=1 Tax=Nicrophorus vespilloides TaxID=110193 RepID=A0ABM1N874_NICVS|nr:PREDICTED: pheromone-binding protein-related protein 6-like [Nicrophorus vespilloides]